MTNRYEKDKQAFTGRYCQQTDSIKRYETFARVILYLEIVLSVEKKTAEKPTMVTDDVGQQVVQINLRNAQ